ncbi:TetR family transcriptional regulator [Paenibacillus sp. 1011MAR3C5]|uniref:TetR family transcriptional regulator n=1 Tax=Paenibacillus sp. 1011MAR3C5 TaxID=1675787 RepID=UPI000E6CCEAE|nr:TetR family transcriptional regulator [Paenibacillus sp. 1011MAR3C5]RJE89731.1 TetR family transcriptional regulator [Paenibacillus sp. 1011MAR3C5]
MRRTKEDANETLRKLIGVAKKHFTEHGYAGAALEAIAADAEVTRGALYHHFRNKHGLFLSVLESVQQEVGERVEQEASRSDDLREQLLLGCRAFLTAAVEPENKRIMLIDGPSVLGWDTWRMLDEKNSMSHLREQLTLMQEQGMFEAASVEALAAFISGGLNESALRMAELPDTAAAMEQTMKLMSHLVSAWDQRL